MISSKKIRLQGNIFCLPVTWSYELSSSHLVLADLFLRSEAEKVVKTIFPDTIPLSFFSRVVQQSYPFLSLLLTDWTCRANPCYLSYFTSNISSFALPFWSSQAYATHLIVSSIVRSGVFFSLNYTLTKICNASLSNSNLFFLPTKLWWLNLKIPWIKVWRGTLAPQVEELSIAYLNKLFPQKSNSNWLSWTNANIKVLLTSNYHYRWAHIQEVCCINKECYFIKSIKA